MDEKLCADIWEHIGAKYQEQLTAAWPKVDA
jgi:hypothetical protein